MRMYAHGTALSEQDLIEDLRRKLAHSQYPKESKRENYRRRVRTARTTKRARDPFQPHRTLPLCESCRWSRTLIDEGHRFSRSI